MPGDINPGGSKLLRFRLGESYVRYTGNERQSMIQTKKQSLESIYISLYRPLRGGVSTGVFSFWPAGSLADGCTVVTVTSGELAGVDDIASVCGSGDT